jgi:hypothetical protein
VDAAPGGSLHEAVLQLLEDALAERPQHDDVTIVTARFAGGAAGEERVAHAV